jgi:signal transduction histidine kinase
MESATTPSRVGAPRHDLPAGAAPSADEAARRLVGSVVARESPEAIARDVFAVQQIQAVPTLLQVVCEIAGMRFAAVARVAEGSCTLCAVKDDIGFGLRPGSQLDVEKTLCIGVKRCEVPVVIEHASLDSRNREHRAPMRYQIESYVSVPIVLASGRYFGNLCAIDPAPVKISAAILNTFNHFAALIAMQLDNEITREDAAVSLRDERAASELREQFIAILGHDLRNPLQAIAATSELMIRKVHDPVIAGMASRIKANSRRMSSLIDDVLDFARGRLGGGIGLHWSENENINAAFTAVVKELQDAHPDRAIQYDFSVSRTVHCDLGRMQQVASNLVSNALTHGASDKAVKVTARADGHEMVFEVWNEGEPIPPDNMPKVFEPFWRQDTSANREGLGLGLHICSQILRAHGGQLSVTSSRAEGTTFTARVPLPLL